MIIGEPSVFVWMFHDPNDEVTYKIYAFARDVGEARRILDIMPNSAQARAFYRTNRPAMYPFPWAEVNVSGHGKGAAWAFGKTTDELS